MKRVYKLFDKIMEATQGHQLDEVLFALELERSRVICEIARSLNDE